MLLDHFRQMAQGSAAGRPGFSSDGQRLLMVAIVGLLLGASAAILAVAILPQPTPVVPWQWNLTPVASGGNVVPATEVRLLSTLSFDSGHACDADQLPVRLAANLDKALEGLPTGTTRHMVFLVAAGHDRLPLRSHVYESNIALAQARSDCVARHIRKHPICTSRPAACSVVNFVRSASDPLTDEGKVQEADRAAQILVLSHQVSSS